MKQLDKLQYELAKKNLLQQILTKKARERLANIRSANPTFAHELEQVLISMAQAGQLQLPIDDSQFKSILERIHQNKKKFRIIRK